MWEKGDGAVYLIGELSAIDECKPKLTNSILKAAEVCRNHHYVAHFSLIETVRRKFMSLKRACLLLHIKIFFTGPENVARRGPELGQTGL